MVFYRGLEHLIKAFYSACLILRRSLNCRASKCQCPLNIYIPSFRKEAAEMAKTEGKPSRHPQKLRRERLGEGGKLPLLLVGLRQGG